MEPESAVYSVVTEMNDMTATTICPANLLAGVLCRHWASARRAA